MSTYGNSNDDHGARSAPPSLPLASGRPAGRHPAEPSPADPAQRHPGRVVLRLAVPAGPGWQPDPLRPAAPVRTVQPDPRAGLLVDRPARPAGGPGATGASGVPERRPWAARRGSHLRWMSSYRSTTNRSEWSSRRSPRPGGCVGPRPASMCSTTRAATSLAAMARRLGARYVRRKDHRGAKAGNLNHALRLSTSPLVAVFDCDHVPHPDFLNETMPLLEDPSVAFVQTPQYYANHGTHRMAAAAWSQQALFFGIIAQGKAGPAVDVLLRHERLVPPGRPRRRGRLPGRLAHRGLPSVPATARAGAGTVRTCRGCWPKGWGRRTPPPTSASSAGGRRGASRPSRRFYGPSCPGDSGSQYLLSASYFLSGWTILVYLSLPMIRILTGQQPLARATAAQFLGHFIPYYTLCILIVAVAGAGTYTFAGLLRLGEQFLDPRRRHHGRHAAPPRRFRGDPETRFRRPPAGGGRPRPQRGRVAGPGRRQRSDRGAHPGNVEQRRLRGLPDQPPVDRRLAGAGRGRRSLSVRQPLGRGGAWSRLVRKHTRPGPDRPGQPVSVGAGGRTDVAEELVRVTPVSGPGRHGSDALLGPSIRTTSQEERRAG